MKKTFFSLLPALILLIGTSHSIAQTWEKINTGYNYILKGIEFPGNQSQIGWAAGQSLTYNGNGIVIKTTNGGTSWTQLWTGTQHGLNAISSPDMNTGYICGQNAFYAKSTDGGVTWTPSVVSTDVYEYMDMAFKDALHGVIAAQTNLYVAIYATSDGGATWTAGTGLSAVPYKVCYVTANTYFLVTNSGDILKSTDGGLTWVTSYSAGGLLLGIDFYNPMIGIAAGEDGRIIKTYDGGATWTQQVIAFGNPLWHDFAWYDENNVYVCGTPEQIYKSTDGGSTWNDDYPQSTLNPALYEIMFTADGYGYVCGSQGWFYRLAPQLNAAFTSNVSQVCNGGTVQFTDQSIGTPTAWDWTFPGGNPATSTLQNPVVTYSTPGVYDVTLHVTKGTINSTVIIPGMITVEAPVTAIPAQPSGPTSICGAANYQYSTTSVAGAISYIWTATPTSAGTFSGTGLTGTLAASNTWDGAFTVQTAGTNSCGTGPASPVLSCTLYHQPIVYSLYSGGGYCAGQAGYEIKLENSEIVVDYQLYKDGVASGSPVPGTGTTLSFGTQTVGTYTVDGTNGSCSANMQGSAEVFIIDPVAAANQPTGPTSMCNNVPGTYTASLPANGFSLVWTVTPSSAGTLTQPTLNTAAITWNAGYYGYVAVTVQGQNECGTGSASPALTVTVNALPAPDVMGSATVCKNQEITYETDPNPGDSFVWIVTGGNITSGQGSHYITVLWGNPGVGTVAVTETSAAACSGSSPLVSVAINECTGISETNTKLLTIYPNPAQEQLNVLLGSSLKTPVRVFIYNHLGQLVYQSAEIKTASANPVIIDIANLNPGTYTLRVTEENETFSRIFVKK